jgi:CRP-like cAMP-binding protein
VEVIVSGNVRLSVHNETIGAVSVGSAVGASAAFAHKPHSYTATALDDVVTESVTAAAFLGHVASDPALLRSVLECVNHEAALATRAMKHLRSTGVRK